MKIYIKIYSIIAVVCFLGLAVVQFILLYNTYELLNNRFYYDKKGRMSELYARAITNDKIFPGAQPVIDSIIVPQYPLLDSLQQQHSPRFDTVAQQMLTRVFTALQQYRHTDSLIRDIRTKGNITDLIHYAFCIHRIQLRLSGNNYINIYDLFRKYPLIPAQMQRQQGIYIAGDLQDLNDGNCVTSLNISSPEHYSYAINYSFYADPYDRQAQIMQQMRQPIFLSLLTLLAITALFIFTLRNWLRQQQLSQLKSDFIDSITHEFNTPLTAIIVANKNISNEKTLENRSAVLSLSDIIYRQSERLKLLIGQVLDVASASRQLSNKKPYDLNTLIEEILTAYRLKIPGQDICIRFTEKATATLIYVDTFQFTTLLQNLLDNAIKYNHQQYREIMISTIRRKDSLELHVADNGTGMHERTKRRIFDKFYRHADSNTIHIKGLGLGLYYVKQFTDAHKWKITVESTVGKGTTFYVNHPG